MKSDAINELNSEKSDSILNYHGTQVVLCSHPMSHTTHFQKYTRRNHFIKIVF